MYRLYAEVHSLAARHLQAAKPSLGGDAGALRGALLLSGHRRTPGGGAGHAGRVDDDTREYPSGAALPVALEEIPSRLGS